MNAMNSSLVVATREAGAGRPRLLVQPRPLSFDERQAAEAAYQRHPLNPALSLSAQVIYWGMASLLAERQLSPRAGEPLPL